MIDDDDPWANIDSDEQPTQHIRTERAVPPGATSPPRSAQPTPPGTGGSSRILLIVLGIVALLAVLAAAALGSSRSEWKDRAETSEAKLQVAQDEAAEADAEVVPPGGDVEPDTTKPTTPTEPKPDPEEPATEAKITDCDDFGITGEADPDGGAYYSISTRNLDCAAAKELILGRGFDGDGRAEAEGYTCTRLAKVDETTEWRCEQDDVAFRYSFGL